MKRITEEEVQHRLSMAVAVEAMEEAFAMLGQGQAENVPRQRSRAKGIVLHSMSAAAEYLGLVGWKQYTTTRNGAKFHVGIYNREGDLIALIDADRLGQMRTGATTGLAVKHLTDPQLDSFALIGTGWQAESQLEAVVCVRPIKTAMVFSRNEQKRQDFAQRMRERHNIRVIAAPTSSSAVADQSLVVTATSSRTPVLADTDVAQNALICAVGSNWLEKTELELSTVRTAAGIVCDDIACCKHEAGDFCAAIEAGEFDWSDAIELSQVVTGMTSVPSNGRIIFKSVGMALEDVALAARLL